MNKIKKSLMLCVGLLTLPTYAAQTAQEGVEVSLIPDKTTYD